MTTDYRPSAQSRSGHGAYPVPDPQPGKSQAEGNSLTDHNGNHHQPGEEPLVMPNSPTPTMTYRGVAYGPGAELAISVTKPAQRKWVQWFSNLSVGRKQLTGLFTSEVISVVGLVGVGSFLIVMGGRSQLLNQARSELAVTNIAYNIKINQMGFGFRGQSDNQAIVNAATTDAAGGTISAESLDTVRHILENEIKARQIEYATLVGRDLTIIASANADRRGETFDPEGLVGTVFKNPRQIKASAIVSWKELQREQPPLPEGFQNQDALIRYTFTPVKAANSDQVVGVLVSGDIVNGKADIPTDTLAAFETGYSAVYQRQEDGTFALAASLNAQDNPDIKAAAANIPLDHLDLLNRAVASPNRVVSGRNSVAGETYTLATKAIEDFNGEPVAVLVRGTSETPLNQLIGNSLKLQLLMALLALAADFFLARLLGRSILRPLRELQQAAWKFGMGDHTARADIYATDEVGQVAQAFNQMAEGIVASEVQLRQQNEQEKVVAQRSQTLLALTNEIRKSMEDDQILSTSVEGLRAALNVDRVVIYRFHPDLKSGEITAESVAQGWTRLRGQTVEDPLTPEALEHFYTGKVAFIEDRDRAGLTHCHCEILERLQVRANMVAPILAGDRLMGLLCAHQCSGPRQWTPSELDMIQQLSAQIGYALSQANLLKQQRQIAFREQQLTEVIAHMRESLEEAEIFRIAVTETRQAMNGDRTIVYLFDETWNGRIVAESVGDAWPKSLHDQLHDPCFADKYIKPYEQGRIQATPDIYKAGLTQCHIQQLEAYQVKANLVAPILVNERLVGLLIVHQCSGPRDWDMLDINLIRQVSIQLGYAIEQARLFGTIETLAEERRQKQEALQMQLVELLSDVEGASDGDLTVRANVTAGEIGTVADFFNAIVESLRQIVTKVKQSAEQVNASLGESESSVQVLADEALRQADEVTQTLASVEEMTNSIKQVADSARQAAIVAGSASATAETSGQAMDLTVQNILKLRDIIGETSKKVKRLGESSQQISKVVSLINQIAMQTNLLAINAGIEAARAGEEGQGFAVVAEEVGELAARSADATQEIERIVETIQRETVEVVEAMEQSTTEVVAGTHLVEDAKQNLSRIVEVSRQIDQLVQSISTATVSQVEVSDTVSRLMQDIAKVSERTSTSSRQISGSLRQTVEVAQALQASVGTFKTSD